MFEKVKGKLNNLKNNIKEKVNKTTNKIKKWFSVKEHIVDLLVITSCLIIISTTCSLNIYIGLYLLAFILFIFAICISRTK